ncbi:asparagine synthetase B family protein [Rhodovibrio salinarum]|uniref:asparagine synthase (glutamine-hydrolyzing) n=1 Tax=Rhodovibrio salinarum TaxID=1087 RepID=A0A934QFD4_9PROT|nr:asparagine synthase-related protein [Rhodovibrio salinarum]MBK1696016.1 asparagine synthase [Rhodovibrio salinarum]
MPALFGWIGSVRLGGSNQLLRLAATRPGESWNAGDTAANGACALGICGVPDTADRAPVGYGRDEAGRQVAFIGRPRFRAQAWQARVGEIGLPAALLQAYLARGDGLAAQLVGAFALVVLDPVAGRAVLAIDRMGVEQLFYAEADGGLVFATDLDILAAHPRVDTEITPQAVYRYALNYVSPAPETIYAGAAKLLPAHALEWCAGRQVQQVPYWHPPAPGSVSGRRDALAEELHDRLDGAVRGTLATHPAQHPGAFLSGGLDSSVVAGLLGQAAGAGTPAFTIAFEDPRYDESSYAACAAAHFGLAHNTRHLSPSDAADLVPTLAAACDEPFGNSSLLPAYVCARMAREAGVDLLLAGDGGDELFAGNKRYVEQKILGLYGHLPGAVRAGLSTTLSALPSRLAVSWLGKAQRYVARAAQPMPERMIESGIYRRDVLDHIFTADALAEIEVDAPAATWRRHYAEAGTDDLVHAMQRLDWRVTLSDNDLRKVQRAGALAGVEIAYPMLDPGLVEFAAGLPSNLLIQRFRLRAFFKDAMVGFLPQSILTKPKHGFGMPFSEWTRSDAGLWALVVDAFAALKTRKIFRADFLDQVLRAHADDSDPELSAIVWDLLMLEIWWQAREAPVDRRVAQAPGHPDHRSDPASAVDALPEASL